MGGGVSSVSTISQKIHDAIQDVLFVTHAVVQNITVNNIHPDVLVRFEQYYWKLQVLQENCQWTDGSRVRRSPKSAIMSCDKCMEALECESCDQPVLHLRLYRTTGNNEIPDDLIMRSHVKIGSNIGDMRKHECDLNFDLSEGESCGIIAQDPTLPITGKLVYFMTEFNAITHIPAKICINMGRQEVYRSFDISRSLELCKLAKTAYLGWVKEKEYENAMVAWANSAPHFHGSVDSATVEHEIAGAIYGRRETVKGGLGETLQLSHGLVLIKYLHGDKTGVNGFLAMSPDKSNFVVAIRGTTNLADWMADFNLVPSPWKCDSRCPPDHSPQTLRLNPAVSDGVKLQFDECKDLILAALDELIGSGQVRLLTVLGHSLGGAIAVLVATMLSERYLFNKRHEQSTIIPIPGTDPTGIPGVNDSLHLELYTFGAPRICNSDFSEYFRKYISERPDTTAFRIVNDLDVIARLPPRNFGFHHSGGEIVYILGDSRARGGRLSDSLLEPATDHLLFNGADGYGDVIAALMSNGDTAMKPRRKSSGENDDDTHIL